MTLLELVPHDLDVGRLMRSVVYQQEVLTSLVLLAEVVAHTYSNQRDDDDDHKHPKDSLHYEKLP